jgi:hypothetical protein
MDEGLPKAPVAHEGAPRIALTVVVAVAELFDGLLSRPSLATVAVLLTTVARGVLAATRATTVKTLVVFAGRVGRVQEIVPAPFTLGVEQVQPAGTLRDWKVVSPGSVSIIEAFGAAFPPAGLFTVIV